MENTMKYTAIYTDLGSETIKTVVITEKDLVTLVEEIISENELDIYDKEFSQVLSELIVVFEGELCPKQLTVRKSIEIQ